MSSPYNVGVGTAVFVCREGKVLIQQRNGAHGANTWAPPGGKMDYDEIPEQTAIREVKEETDLDLKNLTYLGFTNDIFEAENLHFITLWYATNEVAGTPKITEPGKCLAQEWFTLDEIPTPLFLPTEQILKDEAAIRIVKELLEDPS